MKKELTDKDKIIYLMYYVAETLGADPWLLAPLGGYGDTTDEKELLEMLQVWLNKPSTYMKRIDPRKLEKVYKGLDLPTEVGEITVIAEREKAISN